MMGGVFKQNQLREVDEIALAIAESERFRHAIEQGIDAGFQFESVQEQAPKRLAGSFEREATHLRDVRRGGVQCSQRTNGDQSAIVSRAASIQGMIQESVPMAEGSIKRLTNKGFGFIATGGEKDLFFHSSSLVGVSFDDVKAKRCRTRKDGVQKARVPRTSSRSNPL